MTMAEPKTDVFKYAILVYRLLKKSKYKISILVHARCVVYNWHLV